MKKTRKKEVAIKVAEGKQRTKPCLRLTSTFFIMAICLAVLASCQASSNVSTIEFSHEIVDRPHQLTIQVESKMDSMTLEEKVAQMFIVRPEALEGSDAVTVSDERTFAAFDACQVGGIAYFAQNLEDAEQTKGMLGGIQQHAQSVAGIPLFLCVDEEGGTVSRIGGNAGFGIENVGNMSEIGATGDTERAQAVAYEIGSYLTDLGFNVDFAPDADVANNPNSTVMELRSFGKDAGLVASMVKAQVAGFKSAGILSTAKHFPGIGGAEGDSHETGISTEKTLPQMQAEELLPFEAAIDADVPFVMVGHISAPQVTESDEPASLSPAIVEGLLRKELGYSGIIITDSMGMGAVNGRHSSDEAAVLAVKAGVDIVLMPADFQTAYQGLLNAVKSGEIPESRIDESVKRILMTKLAM